MTFPRSIKRIILILLIILIATIGVATVVQASKIPAGYQKGMVVANNVGTGVDKTSGKLRFVQGYVSGISAGYLMGEENMIDTHLIYDDVKKISDIAELLKLDIVRFLNQSNNRADTLDATIDEFRISLAYAQKRSDVLLSQSQALKSAYDQSQGNQDRLQQEVFDSIDQKLPLESEEKLNTFMTTKQQTGTLFTKYKILEHVEGKYTVAKDLLSKKMLFLSANRDALVKGVTVVDVYDPDIKLILTQSEWEQMQK